MIRVLVADDEPLARAGIRLRLAAHADFTVVAEACNGRDAITAIRRHAPAVVFLDVQMPVYDGIRVSAVLRSPAAPLWVFVSAYAEHAVSAFDVEALDYLVKPIDDARFAETLARVRRSLRAQAELEAGAAPPGDAAKILVVRSGKEKVLLPRSDIVWLQSERDWVVVHAHHAQFRVRDRLSALASSLGPDFVRIHRSIVIKRAAVIAVKARTSGEFLVRLSCGAVVTSSRRYRSQIKSLLHSHATTDT